MTPKCSITAIIKNYAALCAHLPVRQKHVNFVCLHQSDHCSSEYGFVSQYKWSQKKFWLGNTKHAVRSCCIDAPWVHHKTTKWSRVLGGSGWCSGIIPSAKISWGLRRCRVAELVPDLMSWCASLSQNRTCGSCSSAIVTTRFFFLIIIIIITNPLYKFKILMLTSQQLVVHNLPHHPSSEVGHVFLWIQKRACEPLLGNHHDDYLTDIAVDVDVVCDYLRECDWLVFGNVICIFACEHSTVATIHLLWDFLGIKKE